MTHSYARSTEVANAQASGSPVVALESTIITHGMPYPQNLEVARQVEEDVRAAGATPATMAVIAGRLHVGLTDAQLEALAQAKDVDKISRHHDRGPSGQHQRLCHGWHWRRAHGRGSDL